MLTYNTLSLFTKKQFRIVIRIVLYLFILFYIFHLKNCLNLNVRFTERILLDVFKS